MKYAGYIKTQGQTVERSAARLEWKYLVVYQGKGTPFEKRIETGIKVYWVESLGCYCSSPED
jgi:hypothetical protein